VLPQRFWDKVNKTDACWLWTGAVTAWGYPKYRTFRHVDAAYRVIWMDLHGPLPAGIELDHLCHTRDATCLAAAECPHRRCVNPDHLEPVTAAENLRRSHRLRETCRNGHEKTPENVRVRTRSDGQVTRDCRVCLRAQKRKAYAKQMAVKRGAGLLEKWSIEE
jgi:hypothetical protein